MSLIQAIARRDFLTVSAGAAIGMGLRMPGESTARANSNLKKHSVILVNLTGGMSHLDTLDMKPEAPSELRGEFKPMSTTVAGLQICEHLPLLASRMKHWALVRSMAHRENGHLPGTHRLLTGATMPNQRITDLDNVLSRRDWPCYAAGLNSVRPRQDGIPNGVTLPHVLIEGPLTWPGQHGGFLGPKHDPMLVTQDPNSPNFRMDTFTLPTNVDSNRVEQRRQLLDQLQANRRVDQTFREQQKHAFELISSGRVAAAFQLQKEADKTRDRFGRNQFGQSLLLAKRLVHAGVPIVQANMGIVQSWDTHHDNWGRLKNQLLPWLDRGLAALVDDLEAEGRLQETFIVVSGEFGRTPKVSNLPGQPIPGRDHWAHAYSALFAGAGVIGGRVIGKTDRIAGHPLSVPYTPFDLGATIYHALGVDPHEEIRDSQNRPSAICTGNRMNILFENR